MMGSRRVRSMGYLGYGTHEAPSQTDALSAVTGCTTDGRRCGSHTTSGPPGFECTFVHWVDLLAIPQAWLCTFIDSGGQGLARAACCVKRGLAESGGRLKPTCEQSGFIQHRSDACRYSPPKHRSIWICSST